ncbi:hypothetical protein L198_04231 [Cryptococcus wingfieldii CBS 7118]|uniref:SEC7 domain-containing protein n=1 Tax=Cryptococcus wingfieldii CBS 7118 TaxID=1295528 RepID=A0A1E3J8V8_9TREE|nr:hypothetical protein L198_04231 [Cryptococcus wingfieldii CBS 7118]ODN96516.1 hypothetical protein L198_04231 [Cryptococcus wingfieldii CBS 7118]
MPPMARSNPSSPNPNHRLSTSSNRSLKKSEADFEAALRDTGATLFLSAGPAAIGEEPETESASGASEATPGLDADTMDSPVYSTEAGKQRSYEDDFKELGRKSQDERVGLGVGSVGMGSPVRGTFTTPGVIPPTPTRGHMRAGSVMTTSSAASTGTGHTPGRHARKVSKSLGIDAELGIEPKQKLKKPPPKRRNMFRSAGTSSQPDLASIVRRSTKDKPDHDPPPSAGPTSTASPMSQMTPSTSSKTLYQSPRGVSSPPRAAGTGTAEGTKKENMDVYGSMMGGNQMATIAEGQGTLNRNRSNTSDEGFKSMRNKAKGMFGKMFGSSKDSRLPSNSASASSSRIDIHEMPSQSVPPVPAVPSAYAQQKQRVFNSPPISHPDVFGPTDGSTADRFTLGSPVLPQKSPPPPPRPINTGMVAGRVSTTPTGRRESGASALSIDKPLPAVRVTDQDGTAPQLEKKIGSSLHVRQPANAEEEEVITPVRAGSSRKPVSSPATAAVSSFSADMAGMLADIGQSEPARELGLPPSSMRKKENGRGKFPADLSRTPSQESPPPTGPQRSASLPTTNLAKQESSSPQRASTSHIPSYLATASKAQPNQFSRLRASSGSKIRLETQMEGSEGPLLNVQPSAAPPISPIFGEDKRLDLPSTVKAASQANDASETPSRDSPKSPPPTGPSAWGRQSPGAPNLPESSDTELSRLQSHTGSGSVASRHDDGDVEMMASPPRMPSRADTVNTDTTDTTEDGEELEEKGRRLACELLDEDTTNVAGDKVAEFLGGPHPVNTVALKYYMQYFDMKGQNLVEAFRDLCQKLYLKAESQEIDRIIEAFSGRFFECNPNTTFGSPDVVHTVAAAMLMLNTDLHIAELQKHMSKSEFVRNAMRAIQLSSGTGEDRSSTPDLIRDDGDNQPPSLSSSTSTNYVGSVRAKVPASGATQRSASAPVVTSPPPHHRADSSLSVVGSAVSPSESKLRSSSTTVSSGSFNYGKTWEIETEAALKDIYSSVRADRILLPTASAWGNDRNTTGNKRQSMVSIASNGPYDRAGRVRSPSDRVNVLKRGSIRSVQGLLASNSPYSSQWYSSEGRLSPAPSYANSTNEINSPGSAFSPALGFASNLSHTVIREHDGDDTHSVHSHASVGTIEEMDDDELALLGAPWAKEGILQRKVHSEGVTKRVKKSGDWKQYFVVASKGDVFMFTFGDGKGGGSMSMGGSVGGGNWLENANANGKIPLMHTTSATLPKPGYSSSRPYCFSLTEPSGEVSFFQAGTEDLVAEWVATCNYWAARKSRQPLQGGVSNMEYGWNKVGLDDQDDQMSIMSHRSNMSRLGGTYGRRLGSSSGGGGNDKIYINDWKPPPAASVPSPLEEEAQLEALVAYVKLQEKELERHKAVEEPMICLYSFGSKNLAKAKDNWRAKSHYIHTEIFKYETYIDALRRAIHLRVKKSGEKKLEKSLNSSIHGLHAVAEGKASPLVGAHSVKSEDEEEDNQYEDAAAELGKKTLTIDPTAGQYDDGEEEQPITPGATLRGR